jgi:hypothetical protein
MAYKESIASAAVKSQRELQNPLRKKILLFNVYNILDYYLFLYLGSLTLSYPINLSWSVIIFYSINSLSILFLMGRSLNPSYEATISENVKSANLLITRDYLSPW